ncbi:MAG: HAMP domain-containing sensor histidine kinase, partial [Gemmatimonadales bacterium]
MTVVSIGLGWLMAGRVLRPLRTITATARRISASNLHERLALTGPDDELKELGSTINQLLGRLERSFEAQRNFVANASHELRTPLARQRTLAEVALGDDGATAPSLQAALQRVVAAGEQLERLIEGLLTLARGQRGLNRREPIDLATVAAAQLARLGEESRSRNIRPDALLHHAPILGDPPLTERLVANLVDNAVRHNHAGGWVWLYTGLEDDQATLVVANTGAVIAAEQIDLIFQPFQRLETNRASNEGTGLGLPIVASIATAHDAELSARPLPAGGLEIEVRFPCLPVTAVTSRSPEDEHVTAGQDIGR